MSATTSPSRLVPEGITVCVDPQRPSRDIVHRSERLASDLSLRVPVPPAGAAHDRVLAWMDRLVAARLHAEQTRIFRDLLWRRVAVLAGIWLLVGVTTRLLSQSAIAAGLGLFAAAIAGALALDRRAWKALSWLETHGEGAAMAWRETGFKDAPPTAPGTSRTDRNHGRDATVNGPR